MYSTSGVLIKTLKANALTEINVELSNVASGNYFARIASENKKL
ncbi:hypothetical protein [Aquimarina agarivorans]